MSFFHWLTTGSSNGILLEQEKEPAISKPFSAVLQRHYPASADI